MIDKDYKDFYKKIFREMLDSYPKNYFDESALPSYTHKNGFMSWLFWERLNSAFYLAGDIKDKKILDFGAGGGVTFKYLANKDALIYACEKDFYELTNKVAKLLNLNIPIFANIYEIKNIKFDLILALDVLEHIDDLKPIIEKFIELSDKKTKFIISGPTESFVYKIGRLLAGFKGHYHLKNIYQIEQELAKAGLKKIKVKKLYPPFTLFRISLWEF